MAAKKATEANEGKVISPAHLRTLPPAVLASFGVLPLEVSKPPQSTTDYSEFVEGPLVLKGDLVIQEWDEVDVGLDRAKAEAYRLLEQAADAHREADVPVSLPSGEWQFPMDADAVLTYNMMGTALASGVPYPSEGVPFYAKASEAGKRVRVRVSEEEWRIVVGTVASKVMKGANHESSLEASIDSAASLSELRTLDVHMSGV